VTHRIRDIPGYIKRGGGGREEARRTNLEEREEALNGNGGTKGRGKKKDTKKRFKLPGAIERRAVRIPPQDLRITKYNRGCATSSA